MSLKSELKPREADIIQPYCLIGIKLLPALPETELTTSGKGSMCSSAQPIELGRTQLVALLRLPGLNVDFLYRYCVLHVKYRNYSSILLKYGLRPVPQLAHGTND